MLFEFITQHMKPEEFASFFLLLVLSVYTIIVIIMVYVVRRSVTKRERVFFDIAQKYGLHYEKLFTDKKHKWVGGTETIARLSGLMYKKEVVIQDSMSYARIFFPHSFMDYILFVPYSFLLIMNKYQHIRKATTGNIEGGTSKNISDSGAYTAFGSQLDIEEFLYKTDMHEYIAKEEREEQMRQYEANMEYVRHPMLLYSILVISILTATVGASYWYTHQNIIENSEQLLAFFMSIMSVSILLITVISGWLVSGLSRLIREAKDIEKKTLRIQLVMVQIVFGCMVAGFILLIVVSEVNKFL